MYNKKKEREREREGGREGGRVNEEGRQRKTREVNEKIVWGLSAEEKLPFRNERSRIRNELLTRRPGQSQQPLRRITLGGATPIRLKLNS